jgi:hypothetical protein
MEQGYFWSSKRRTRSLTPASARRRRRFQVKPGARSAIASVARIRPGLAAAVTRLARFTGGPNLARPVGGGAVGEPHAHLREGLPLLVDVRGQAHHRAEQHDHIARDEHRGVADGLDHLDRPGQRGDRKLGELRRSSMEQEK